MKSLLLVLTLLSNFISIDTGLAQPNDGALAVAKEAANFCLETSRGREYPSVDACMEYQKGGAGIVLKAVNSGYIAVALNCMSSSVHEGYIHYAAAGLCIAALKPELFAR